VAQNPALFAAIASILKKGSAGAGSGRGASPHSSASTCALAQAAGSPGVLREDAWRSDAREFQLRHGGVQSNVGRRVVCSKTGLGADLHVLLLESHLPVLHQHLASGEGTRCSFDARPAETWRGSSAVGDVNVAHIPHGSGAGQDSPSNDAGQGAASPILGLLTRHGISCSINSLCTVNTDLRTVHIADILRNSTARLVHFEFDMLPSGGDLVLQWVSVACHQTSF
jgi:hypothetical protein